MRTVIFIPVWNQIADFPKVVEELKSNAHFFDEVVIVNNGSTDGSEKVAHESGYAVIDFPQNMGVGYAYIEALKWAREHNFDIMVTMAANGKMSPAELPRLLDPIKSGEADYVTGSRYLKGGASPNLPLFRRIAIPLVNCAIFCLYGKWLSDFSCGFRALRLSNLDNAPYDWQAEWLHGYSFEYYLYAKMLLGGFRCKEVPITMKYPPRGRSYSKIPPGVGWYQMVRPWFIARFESLAGR
jgi:glycosyltransferase involved in cell wall biosynthesis